MMKHKADIRKILALLMLLVLILVPVQAAGDVDMDILFKAGQKSPVLDPDNPSKEWKDYPKDDYSTSQILDSVFVTVPNFNFGSDNPLNYGKPEFHLVTPERTFIQVADLRGKGTGWKLNVTASYFEGDGKTIKGAQIHLKNGKITTSNQALKDTDKSPTLAKEVIIKCDNDPAHITTVMDASFDPSAHPELLGKGMGAWVAYWYPQNAQGQYDNTSYLQNKNRNTSVTLTIPAAQLRVGQYTATLDWTLEDTP